MKYFKIQTIILCCLALFFLNCEGEDGTDGTSSFGASGINGIDGTNGVDGVDGENSASYEELTQYGSISILIEGKRPDGVDFSKTEEFKFSTLLAENISTLTTNDNNYTFDLTRFLTHEEDFAGDPGCEIFLTINNFGETTETFELDVGLWNYLVVSSDYKYFIINDAFLNNGDGISNIEITDYSFDDETNQLIFSFSLQIAGDNNDTENDLFLSGEVDVIVFEEM
ncbi:hypothetical protein [Aquimarina pacifica]|uniref:hypothetical protein n=1 Tax=Aquimarina pacifica TaxID=1296415 RepID=UPI00046E896D|nr:hypothetical protein [Aquimarina pacifica]